MDVHIKAHELFGLQRNGRPTPTKYNQTHNKNDVRFFVKFTAAIYWYFRTQSNIQDGAFAKIVNGFLFLLKSSENHR